MRTKFEDIQFNKEFHTYRLNGRELTSATKLVSRIKNPFDRDRLAAKSAAKEGVPVDEILARWDKAGQEGREKGTRLHTHIEQVLRDVRRDGDPFLALNDRTPEEAAFDTLWDKLKVAVQPLNVEWIIGDAALGVAGTADALLWSNDTRRFHLWDWKTGKEFATSSKWGKYLLPPFVDLEECELNYYSIQLSIYRLIIERNTDLELGDSYLVHFDPAGMYWVHKAVDYRARVMEWLKGLADVPNQPETIAKSS